MVNVPCDERHPFGRESRALLYRRNNIGFITNVRRCDLLTYNERCTDNNVPCQRVINGDPKLLYDDVIIAVERIVNAKLLYYFRERK